MAVNVELLQKTLDTIKANPEHWNQYHWHCGTSHCFAGFAELIANGIPIQTDDKTLRTYSGFSDSPESVYWKTERNAQKLLNINDDDASILFAGYNSLLDLERMVHLLAKEDSLDNFSYENESDEE